MHEPSENVSDGVDVAESGSTADGIEFLAGSIPAPDEVSSLSRRRYLQTAGIGAIATAGLGTARATERESERASRTQSDSTVSRIAFGFQDFGGNNNLEVNGDRREVDSLGALSGKTVGSAEVKIATSAASDSGDQEDEAIITGSIGSFSVGGQEFVLDSFEFGPRDDPRASVEFDSVTPDRPSYEVGAEFSSGGVSFRVDSYIYPTGEETDSGSGRISGGSDPEFSTGNANLRVDIGSVPGGGNASLSLTLTDDTAEAGGQAVIDFVLTNEGSVEATGLQGFVDPPSDEWTLSEEPGSFTSLGPGESETIPVYFDVPPDASGEYTFGGLVETDAGTEVSDSATVTVARPAREIEATDIRLLQAAEHSRPEEYSDTVTRSTLEAEDAIPEWSPDPDLVAGKPAVPMFDIEFVDSDIDAEPETEVAIDVTVRWESPGLSDHSFTIPADRVDSFLSDGNPSVGSFTQLLTEFGTGDGYPVVELPAETAGYEVELEPQAQSLSGTTTAHTGVSAVEMPALNVAFVQLTDTEDSTDYEPIDRTLADSAYDFDDVVDASVRQIEYIFPTATVNSEIYAEPVALENDNERISDVEYRQRQQENAWDFAREESDRELDTVVAFCPDGFIGDHNPGVDSARGMVTPGECAQAVLVNLELGALQNLRLDEGPTTAAHEITHYFLWAYTSGEEYGTDDTHMSGRMDEGTTVASTVATLPSDREEIPAPGVDSSPTTADYFGTPVSYMISGPTGGSDTITYRELLANARDGEFSCAWEWEMPSLPDLPDFESVVSITATVNGDGLAVQSARRRSGVAPRDPPEADGEASVHDANGDVVASVGLNTPPSGAQTEADCCATAATTAQSDGTTVLRGQVPFPESAASIELTTSAGTDSNEPVSTTVNPTTATLREELLALPAGIFTADSESARESLLTELAEANEAMQSSEYGEALERLRSLRATVADRLDDEYEPAAPNLPTYSEVVAEIDDRIARAETLLETHRTGTATDSEADGTGLGPGSGLLGIAGARYVLNRLTGDD